MVLVLGSWWLAPSQRQLLEDMSLYCAWHEILRLVCHVWLQFCVFETISLAFSAFMWNHYYDFLKVPPKTLVPPASRKQSRENNNPIPKRQITLPSSGTMCRQKFC